MLHKFNYIVFDTETSGLSPGTIKSPKAIIMEFACIVLDHELKEVERMEFYIKPYIENPEYSQKALDTHNIPINRTIDKGIESKEAIKKIMDLFKKYSGGMRKKPIISGHNLDFDNKFMNMFFALHKKEWRKIYEFDLDTINLARVKYGWKESHLNFQLGTCCAYEDIALNDAHRAMNDVEANTKLLIKYLTDLRSDSRNMSQSEREKKRETFKF